MFDRLLLVDLKKVPEYIIAICILHNICIFNNDLIHDNNIENNIENQCHNVFECV